MRRGEQVSRTIRTRRQVMDISALDRRFYPQYENNWDDELFRKRILQHITSTSTVLDLGAGRGRLRQMHFRGMCKAVYGLDLSPEIVKNPYLDVAKIGTGECIPWPPATFDVVFADNILEHLAAPERVFSEVSRVLKPNGVFLAKTPNRWHYIPLISRLTPTWFHRLGNKLRGRDELDTFPTFYRANSKSKLLQLAAEAHMIPIIEQIEGRPEYLRMPALYPLYPLGVLWERTVNRFPRLASLRVILIAQFTKQ